MTTVKFNGIAHERRVDENGRVIPERQPFASDQPRRGTGTAEEFLAAKRAAVMTPAERADAERWVAERKAASAAQGGPLVSETAAEPTAAPQPEHATPETVRKPHRPAEQRSPEPRKWVLLNPGWDAVRH